MGQQSHTINQLELLIVKIIYPNFIPSSKKKPLKELFQVVFEEEYDEKGFISRWKI